MMQLCIYGKIETHSLDIGAHRLTTTKELSELNEAFMHSKFVVRMACPGCNYNTFHRVKMKNFRNLRKADPSLQSRDLELSLSHTSLVPKSHRLECHLKLGSSNKHFAQLQLGGEKKLQKLARSHRASEHLRL